MNSVHTAMWDPRPPSKHASPLPHPQAPNVRLAHVTKAAPAKRITFYKSGDSQFGGIRMAVHRRSFKCFDALLDDLSQKVPLPFGVRTVTTPRGTHAIKHLEQLQDGGCYICSDRRQIKPVNMELVRKHPGIWYHDTRRPHRPESSSATPPGHLSYRQRRILLVKNSEPGLRRSVVLSRRSTRSLGAFLDEVSEVMQFHVRKLYTAEGRRIDSVQSLMTCPAVLVCVGREAFSPMLVNYIRKSSEEKLPGLGKRSPSLGPRTPGNGARSPATHATRSSPHGTRTSPHGAQSRASEYSETHGSKKSVNFGLETKRSIIHPRSDSSNRSTRFSLSSEKSYGNGVSTKPSIMNEDIEKRVLVNKDGSLSVEMRVRFRLQNEETIQWSTQIKKSPSLTNEGCPLSEAQPHYLQQGQSESCSDPDSASFDPEGVDYSRHPMQHVSEGNQCPCCYQRPEHQYDLWENPAHSHKPPPVPPPHASSHTHTMVRHLHSSSSSSSCNSRRVVRCRAKLSNCGRSSGSEPLQNQIVQEEVCVTEQVERRLEVEHDGDTHIELCSVSRCMASRPLSAVSNSSHVLQSLKEDQDDDLPPSVSQCCHSIEPLTDLIDKPTSKRGSRAVSFTSSCHCGAATPHSTVEAEEYDHAPSRASCRSSRAKTQNSEEEGAADDEDEEIQRVGSGLSGCTGLSGESSRAPSVCHDCGGCKHGSNSESRSRASHRSYHSHRPSPKPATSLSNQEISNNPTEDDDSSDVSTQSNLTNVTNHGRCSAIANILEEKEPSPEAAGNEEERSPSATSAKSHRSNGSRKSGCNGSTDATAEKEERSPSALSAKSNLSAKSHKSHKSNCGCTAEVPDVSAKEEAVEEDTEERALSSLSAKSGASAKTSASAKLSIKVASPTDNTPVDEEEDNETDIRASSALSVNSDNNASDNPDKAERPDSVVSAKSAKSTASAKSRTSHRSTCSHCARAETPGAMVADDPVIEETGQDKGMEVEERTASVMSARSKVSAKSNKSHKSTKASERSRSPRSETGEGEERAVSQMSGRSVNSNRSVKSCNNNGNDIEESPSSVVAEEKENEIEGETQERPESVNSAKLESEERAASRGSSKSHKSHCNDNPRANSEIGDGETVVDRAASALSGKSASSAKSPTRTPSALSCKSHTSAKSSKSHKSNCNAVSPNQNGAEGPSVETNIEEKQSGNQDRVASAMSVKSKTSSTSRKSNSGKNLKSVSPTPNIVTIQTPEGVDTENNERTERAPSAASAKSTKSAKSGKLNVSRASSHKSNANKTTDVVVIETEEANEKVVEDNAPRSSPKRTCSPRTRTPKAPATPLNSHQSPVQQMLLDPCVGETRGPSSLSVRSTASAKSGRSKCRCGSAAALEKAKTEKEGEDKEGEKMENNEELKIEEAPERAASTLSSITRRQRRESGGTEQALSRNSSGSVSLGLPEDQDSGDSDSGKSAVPFHRKTEGGGKTPTIDILQSTEQSATKEDVEGTESSLSPKSNSDDSKNNVSHMVEIPIIEMTRGSEDRSEVEEGERKNTVRASSALSVKSNRSHKSCCSCRGKEPSKMLDTKHKEQNPNQLEIGGIESSSSTKDAPDKRNSSAMSSASASAKVRSKSRASVSVKNANVAKSTAGDSEKNENKDQAISRPASQVDVKEDITDEKAASVRSKSPSCLKPESAKTKASKAKSSCSDKMSTSQKKETRSKSSSGCPVHSSETCSRAETSNETTLSHSLSAADLLKDSMAAARTPSRQSRRSRKQTNQEEELDLTPDGLPNASPNEFVSDWLRSIPDNSGVLELGDGLNEEEVEEQGKVVEEEPAEEVAKEEGSPPEDENIDEEEKVEAEEEEEVTNEEEVECDAAEEEKSSDPAPDDVVVASSRPNNLLVTTDSMPRNWHSSAAVMKVLLRSAPGRSHSMPEVSPVYGHRLSTSARGLLDCLAQLQLIEPAVGPGCDQQKDRNQRYEDIIDILQSLWLTDTRNTETKEDGVTEQVSPPRSSSGVDMSTGSGGSGKENGIQVVDEANQNNTNEVESLHEDEGVEKVVEEEKEEEGDAKGGQEEIQVEIEETTPKQTITEAAEEAAQSDEQSTDLQSPDSLKANENASSSDKSSANDSSKSPTDNERETLGGSSSSSPPTVLRAPLSKRSSQDPDPVWILQLLKKLEKQFMDHYINAMVEFKVRWELNDNIILDTMIRELKEEVSKRIQSSIEREMRKIQSRAGRGGKFPRPPGSKNLSKDSSTTDRRRILKVMKIQSVKTATLSDGDMGEFSDQRSDDEYCPCDACVKKRMDARPPVRRLSATVEAPVQMEFDLLKILQLKKGPSPVAAPKPIVVEVDRVVSEEEGRNLEVLAEEDEEEDEETKDSIKAYVVLDETIPEEDEDMAGEEDQEEEGDEEGEEDETGDGEAGEEEAECQCQCDTNEEESENAAEEEEETSDNTGAEAGEEEETGGSNGETGSGEESDKETVMDATAREMEIPKDDEGEGEEKEAEKEAEVEAEVEAEEGEVCDCKPEEEGEEGEEASGEVEDGDAANDESAPVEEENAEGNEGGDEGTGEGEEESHEDEKGGESKEPGVEASEDEMTSSQGQVLTEGEEAESDNKLPIDTNAEESGDGCVEKDVVEDAVEEFKPEEEGGEEVVKNKRDDGVLMQQMTCTSVESQPGSLEDIDAHPPPSPANNNIEVPKMATGGSTGGGTGQRRSRSPGRVKRRKPKDSDVEMDDL